jgi:hypothetical protein
MGNRRPSSAQPSLQRFSLVRATSATQGDSTPHEELFDVVVLGAGPVGENVADASVTGSSPTSCSDGRDSATVPGDAA